MSWARDILSLWIKIRTLMCTKLSMTTLKGLETFPWYTAHSAEQLVFQNESHLLLKPNETSCKRQISYSSFVKTTNIYCMLTIANANRSVCKYKTTNYYTNNVMLMYCKNAFYCRINKYSVYILARQNTYKRRHASGVKSTGGRTAWSATSRNTKHALPTTQDH